MNSKVSVIIASAGQKDRAASLMAAVKSLEQQMAVDVTVILVFNGPNVCGELWSQFKNRPSVILEYQQQASTPNAYHYGRKRVESEFFCFLDDDDLYIPNTLYLRCNILRSNPNIDVVVSNGFIDNSDSISLLLPEGFELTKPMIQLFQINWLASCGGLFRTSAVDEHYFKKSVKYYEWTMTAFLLTSDRKIAYLSEPTFIIKKTPDSLSATCAYHEYRPDFYNLLLTYPLFPDVKNIIVNHRTESFHHISSIYLDKKQYNKAWKYHLKSIVGRGGFKYIFYTRHLLL